MRIITSKAVKYMIVNNKLKSIFIININSNNNNNNKETKLNVSLYTFFINRLVGTIAMNACECKYSYTFTYARKEREKESSLLTGKSKYS